MAHSGKPMSEIGLDSLNDRLRQSLSCIEDDKDSNYNKPDFRELDLGSPVSPLRTRGSGPTATATTTTTTITTSSSSSSSSGSVSGRNGQGLASRKHDSSHSGELSGSAESSPTGGKGFRQGHSRSDSGGSHPRIYSGGGGSASGASVNSPLAPVNVLPSGNICPSGRVLKTGMASRASKTDVLRSGTGYYGHGSIMRGAAGIKPGSGSGDSVGPAMNSRIGGGDGGLMVGEPTRRGGNSGGGLLSSSNDSEEFKRLGNENYIKGCFSEALSMYDKAIAISPGNAAYHCNRAAALIGLKRFPAAVKECEEAIRLDPRYVRAHHRLGSLLLSLGQVENAKRHLCFPGKADPNEIQKLKAVEKHLSRCTDARRVGDWRSTLREAEAAITFGADICPQLLACKAEALLKLHQLDDPETYLSNLPKLNTSDTLDSQSKFFGVVSDAYLFFVRAQIELSLGRFENALTAVEKAGQIDPRNVEVSVLLSNVRMVSRARARGNDLYKSERYTEACAAYGDGLRLDPSNSVLYCNRAACWHKLGRWELSVDDCNQALCIQPNYTKALLRRAASNCKLERWAEAVKDYEVLRRELPTDTEVAESLFHAQVALKKSRGEEVSNLKFGGEVELVSGLEQFRAAISSPAASVVHFLAASNQQCKQISPVLDALCAKYPSINFLKVDIDESPAIANSENVRFVPTFKIYKKCCRVKEMVCPSPELLESSVRHYSA